jgi:hypothetical protein
MTLLKVWLPTQNKILTCMHKVIGKIQMYFEIIPLKAQNHLKDNMSGMVLKCPYAKV